MNGTKRINGMVIGLVAALALAGCGSSPEGSQAPAAARDKVGGKPGPVTLRLGTEDDDGRPGAEQIRQFAAHVEELSAGQLRIEPVWDANGENDQGGWDQVVARMVVDGTLDMANVPARAWDTEGVTTLRALHAPFLVTSDELVAEVATSELADEMLAGLESIGVTGLALAPESLRHLLAFGEPPLSVAQFDGMVIRVPRSDTTWALFEALGATAADATDPAGPADEAFVAAESSFALAGTLPGSTAIGNLPLFPKVNSLVINSKAYRGLTDDQRQILDDAAQRMVQSAVAAMPDTVEYAAEYCRNGGKIVLADDGFQAELHNAVEPVYTELRRDPTTKSLIERIRALGEEIGAQPPDIASCEDSEAEPTASAQGTGTFPDGVYRAEVTIESLLEAGVDRPTAANHDGTWTLGFRDGQLLDPGCPGSTYSVVDGRIVVELGPIGDGCGTAAGQVLFSAGWTYEGDQLRFLDVRSGHGSDLLIEALFGRSWTKIE